MRRIIERVVTVVTTTTWKISWENDPPHASRDPEADPIPSAKELPDAAQTAQTTPPIIEVKEADLTRPKYLRDLTADEPPDDPDFYQSKKGNEKP